MLYTMMQVCKQTNMTYQALKFYCNEGLIPNVKRDKNNRRVFDEHDIAWISSLICLKKCGMSIQEMKEYLAMCLQAKKPFHSARKCSRASRRLCVKKSKSWRTVLPISIGNRTFMMRFWRGNAPMRVI